MKGKISERDRHTAEYAGDIARELAVLCRHQKLLTLAYLFDMAVVESLEIKTTITVHPI
jgi:hypothetical protein